MERKALSDKILVLGVDGMDPRYAKFLMDQGKMPHLEELVKRGSCREDLVLLGAQPTVTPSQWTTLSTGAYPMTHGITCFFRQSKDSPDVMEYNMNSQLCKAEPLWNVFAEAGKKTLVWHWPGNSWPPTSNNENLYVVDGTSPGSVCMGTNQIGRDFIVGASEMIEEVTFKPEGASNASEACVVNDIEVKVEKKKGFNISMTQAPSTKLIILDKSMGQGGAASKKIDICQSPIRSADERWKNAPEEAKEFTILFSEGLISRPALILKNAMGQYDHVAVYKSKKDDQPFVVLELGKMKNNIIEDCFKGEERKTCNYDMKLLELETDGSRLKLYVTAGVDVDNNSVWHPKRIYKDIVEHVGNIPPTSQMGGQDKQLINECMLDAWNVTKNWQAKSINYLIDHEGLDVVFSHFHAVDLQTHMFIRFLADTGYNKLPFEDYKKFMDDVYMQTDDYLGQFLYRLDEGWTILLVSDHALVAPKHNPPMIGNMGGVNLRLMEQLGYTYLKKDENGNEMEELDWEKTKAVACRGNHIYINLKGRYEHGIVEPEDKYELEEQIISDLYSYRDPDTNKRVVALALHNKDGALLGLSGPECGDIVYWVAEGYNYDHTDGLSTTYGEYHTSLSPIFVAAGKGIKQGFTTDRVVRQVDVAPTMAILGGVRFPAQCEGAPAYQIFNEEI